MKPNPFVSLNHFTVPVAIRSGPSRSALLGCRPAPTFAFVGAVVLYRSGGSPVKTSRGAVGHLTYWPDEHFARLRARRRTDDPLAFHPLDHARRAVVADA